MDIVKKYINKDGSFYKKYSSGWKMKSEMDQSLPAGINQGGIYVFWWLNNMKVLRHYGNHIASGNIMLKVKI